MADPTDEILRALATRSGEARLVTDCGRVGFAVGDRCLTIDRIAAELLRHREVQRAADALAEAAEAGHHDSCRHTGDGTACDGCALPERVAAYRAARGER